LREVGDGVDGRCDLCELPDGYRRLPHAALHWASGAALGAAAAAAALLLLRAQRAADGVGEKKGGSVVAAEDEGEDEDGGEAEREEEAAATASAASAAAPALALVGPCVRAARHPAASLVFFAALGYGGGIRMARPPWPAALVEAPTRAAPGLRGAHWGVGLDHLPSLSGRAAADWAAFAASLGEPSGGGESSGGGGEGAEGGSDGGGGGGGRGVSGAVSSSHWRDEGRLGRGRVHHVVVSSRPHGNLGRLVATAGEEGGKREGRRLGPGATRGFAHRTLCDACRVPRAARLMHTPINA